MKDLIVGDDVTHEEVERMYEVFRNYSAQKVMLANCGCCEPFNAEAIYSKSLRTLSSADLLDYFYLAMNVGNEDDFRHFLPRILELFVIEEKPYFRGTILVDKIKEASCQLWPSREREALLAFFQKAQSMPRLKKWVRSALKLLDA